MLFSLTAFAQQTFDTDFTQTKVMKVSGKTTEKAGHLTFDGVDQLSMIYSEPEGDYFKVEGNIVKINMDGKKVEILNVRFALLNCLSGNWEQAATDNNAELIVTEEKGLKNISIVAKGKVPKGGYKSVELTYRVSDNTLVKMVLEEAIGIINTYEIH